MGRSFREQVKKVLLDDTLFGELGEEQTLRDFWGLDKDADPTLLMTSEGNDYPITYVNWEEAQEFCQRLTERERRSGCLPAGWSYGLPTEAQWEYACRAGTSTALSSGPLTIEGENNGPELDEIAWYGGNSSEGRSGRGLDTENWSEKQYPGGLANTRKGGQKRANPWGLHDMIGNVREWCEDWYGSYPQDFVVDPSGPPKGQLRVLRGGSWYENAWDCRSAYRNRIDPSLRFRNFGFRLSLHFLPQALAR